WDGRKGPGGVGSNKLAGRLGEKRQRLVGDFYSGCRQVPVERPLDGKWFPRLSECGDRISCGNRASRSLCGPQKSDACFRAFIARLIRTAVDFRSVTRMFPCFDISDLVAVARLV